MKNKLIYVFILFFSVSMISSAKKIQGTCNRSSACTKLNMEKCKETKKTEAANEAEFNFPSLGLFFFNI
ncbi:MAG TPA: hypothetical protein VFH08_16510 [Chitinophagaceae bacterium]|nr:hypothetical protein [Chitinophagaceae bacterium]